MRRPTEAASDAPWSARFEPFAYTLDITTPATGTFRGALQLDSDADFIITSTMFRSDIVITNVPQTDVLFRTQGDRQFSNQQVPIGLLFGDGQRPFIWPAPRRVLKGSYFAVTLFKRADETIETFQLRWDGFKVLDESVVRVEMEGL